MNEQDKTRQDKTRQDKTRQDKTSSQLDHQVIREELKLTSCVNVIDTRKSAQSRCVLHFAFCVLWCSGSAVLAGFTGSHRFSQAAVRVANPASLPLAGGPKVTSR